MDISSRFKDMDVSKIFEPFPRYLIIHTHQYVVGISSKLCMMVLKRLLVYTRGTSAQILNKSKPIPTSCAIPKQALISLLTSR